MFGFLTPAEMVEIHARMCRTHSRAFTGLCYRNDNCAMACMSEGFDYGYCTALQRICMCANPCRGPPVIRVPPPGGLEPPYVEEALLASQETSASYSEKEVSPAEAPSPSPEEPIINIRASPVEAPPVEAPGPRSTKDEKYPFSHKESPEEMSLPYEEKAYPKRKWATSGPSFHFDNMN